MVVIFGLVISLSWWFRDDTITMLVLNVPPHNVLLSKTSFLQNVHPQNVLPQNLPPQNILPQNILRYKTSDCTKYPPPIQNVLLSKSSSLLNILHYKTSFTIKSPLLQNFLHYKCPALQNVLHYKASFTTKRPPALNQYMKICFHEKQLCFDILKIYC
jgi:hypothetical protein